MRILAPTREQSNPRDGNCPRRVIAQKFESNSVHWISDKMGRRSSQQNISPQRSRPGRYVCRVSFRAFEIFCAHASAAFEACRVVITGELLQV
jgi:hypothetical protein